jgi:CubicO group peptidase (beta-lactamase class C family)
MYAYGRIDDLDLKATIVQVLDRWPCAGLAVAVITDGGIAWFRGHGFADAAAKTPVTETRYFASDRLPRPSLQSL